jgi:hypothetical protein
MYERDIIQFGIKCIINFKDDIYNLYGKNI